MNRKNLSHMCHYVEGLSHVVSVECHNITAEGTCCVPGHHVHKSVARAALQRKRRDELDARMYQLARLRQEVEYDALKWAGDEWGIASGYSRFSENE